MTTLPRRNFIFLQYTHHQSILSPMGQHWNVNKLKPWRGFEPTIFTWSEVGERWNVGSLSWVPILDDNIIKQKLLMYSYKCGSTMLWIRVTGWVCEKSRSKVDQKSIKSRSKVDQKSIKSRSKVEQKADQNVDQSWPSRTKGGSNHFFLKINTHLFPWTKGAQIFRASSLIFKK
jgi:hypothetical protein